MSSYDDDMGVQCACGVYTKEAKALDIVWYVSYRLDVYISTYRPCPSLPLPITLFLCRWCEITRTTTARIYLRRFRIRQHTHFTERNSNLCCVFVYLRTRIIHRARHANRHFHVHFGRCEWIYDIEQNCCSARTPHTTWQEKKENDKKLISHLRIDFYNVNMLISLGNVPPTVRREYSHFSFMQISKRNETEKIKKKERERKQNEHRSFRCYYYYCVFAIVCRQLMYMCTPHSTLTTRAQHKVYENFQWVRDGGSGC